MSEEDSIMFEQICLRREYQQTIDTSLFSLSLSITLSISRFSSLSIYLSLHLSIYIPLFLPDWVSSWHAIVFWLVSRTVERGDRPFPPSTLQCGMAFREREQPFLVRRASEKDGRLRFSRDFSLSLTYTILGIWNSAAVAGCRRRHIRPLFRGLSVEIARLIATHDAVFTYDAKRRNVEDDYEEDRIMKIKIEIFDRIFLRIVI